MQVLIDETGDFNRYPVNTFGILTLVSLVDSKVKDTEEQLKKIYTLGKTKVKSSDLTDPSRELFVKFLKKTPEIKFTSIVVDLSLCNDGVIEKHQRNQIKLMDIRLEEMFKDSRFTTSYIASFTILRNQIRNLSLSDYMKYTLMVELLAIWQQHFQFDYINSPLDKDAWDINLYIDTQNKQDKFKKILEQTLGLSFNHQNPNYKIYTPVEWQGKHPLIQRYSVNGDTNKVDGNNFYKNLQISTEQDTLLLNLPDFIGNLIYKSLTRGGIYTQLLSCLSANRSITLTKHNHRYDFYRVSGLDSSKCKLDISSIITKNWNDLKTLLTE